MAEQEGDTGTIPEIPSVTVKSGWKTSQGQMTGLFTLVCLILSIFGFQTQPDDITNWVDRIEGIVAAILPLLISVAPLMSYITSRGKTASNALNANAAIKVAAMTPVDPATLGLADKVRGGLVGGTVDG